MVERFFGSLKCNSDGDDDDEPAEVMTLLTGPPSSGKTSLAFQYALNLAAKSHVEVVVFICNRRRFHANPPFLSPGIDPGSHLFNRIHIKYMEDDESLKKYFAAFHLHHQQDHQHHFPLAVIIDDFADFFHDRECQQRYSNARGRDLAMVRVLALCHSAITHANSSKSKSKSKSKTIIPACRLLLTDTHHGHGERETQNPRLYFLYKRWVSSFFTINRQGHESTSFILKENHPDGNHITKIATYSISLQSLLLEAITESSFLQMVHQ